MRKSIRHFPRKGTGRAQDANRVETFATRNENCAAAESSLAEITHPTSCLAFRPPVLNHPLRLIELTARSRKLREWVRELSESDISLRYALDWRPSPQSRENTFLLFLSAQRSPFMRLSTLCESSRAGKTHRCQRRWCEKLAGNYFVGCIFDGSSRLADKSVGKGRTWISGRGQMCSFARRYSRYELTEIMTCANSLLV